MTTNLKDEILVLLKEDNEQKYRKVLLHKNLTWMY